MARHKHWTLRDLLDFEQILRSERASTPTTERAIFRKSVKAGLEGVTDRSAQRRLGLLSWLAHVRSNSEAELPGAKVLTALSFATVALCVVFFLSGITLVLGLLEQPDSVFNSGHFLFATLGIQWLLLAIGLLLFLVRRRATDSLALFGSLVLKALSRFVPDGVGAWKGLAREGGRYRDVCLWTLAKIGQGAGVSFNLGLIAGLIGVFLFQDVRFYWETTSTRAPEEKVQGLTRTLSLPWAWALPATALSEEDVEQSRLKAGESAETLTEPTRWPGFMLMALIVYGLLPRLGFLIYSDISRRKALKSLDFQGPLHRELWRKMTHVERVVETAGQEDEAVVIEIGGLDLDLSRVSPFLRSKLRIHPLRVFQLGVIDEEKEAAAYEALKDARGGVVFLVEGWSLSPRQMTRLHKKVRGISGPDLQIWIVVISEEISQPNETELQNWKQFIDTLEDPACDVLPYEPESVPASVGKA